MEITIKLECVIDENKNRCYYISINDFVISGHGHYDFAVSRYCDLKNELTTSKKEKRNILLQETINL